MCIDFQLKKTQDPFFESTYYILHGDHYSIRMTEFWQKPKYFKTKQLIHVIFPNGHVEPATSIIEALTLCDIHNHEKPTAEQFTNPWLVCRSWFYAGIRAIPNKRKQRAVVYR